MNNADYKKVFRVLKNITAYDVIWKVKDLPIKKPKTIPAPSSIDKFTLSDVIDDFQSMIEYMGIYYSATDGKIRVAIVTDSKDEAVKMAKELVMKKFYK